MPADRRGHDATRRGLVALPHLAPLASPRAGRAAGHVRETQALVVLQRMPWRSVAGRQRPVRETLEISNARIAPPGGFLLLDREESAHIVIALRIHLAGEARP